MTCDVHSSLPPTTQHLTTFCVHVNVLKVRDPVCVPRPELMAQQSRK